MDRNPNKLEKEVKEILTNGEIDTVVELSDLSETTYNQLAEMFGEDYNVRKIVNILNINERRNYTLHIMRTQDAEM